MNRTVVIATGVAALAGAGVAIAAAVGGSSVGAASATLAVSNVQANLQTCTSQAGALTAGTLNASATATSSQPALSGTARFVLRGSIDNETNAGTFSGALRINTTSGPDTLASFTGVYANGELHGLLSGRSPFTGRSRQSFDRLVGNLSANLNPTTGQLSSVKIGQTDSGGPAVLITPGGTCKAPSSGGSDR